MSDIHLNNHTHPQSGIKPGQSRRPLVDSFLERILEEAHPEGVETCLVLNGDILDVTCSWPANVDPLHMTEETCKKTVKAVLDKILENNPSIIRKLKAFLKQPNTQILYVLGNHDRWLSDTTLQAYLREKLGLEPDSPNLLFDHRMTIPEIGLLALHGDEFDPYCRPPKKGLSRAERLDMLLINNLVNRVGDRLAELEYKQDCIQDVQESIRDIEHVRPVFRAVDFLMTRMDALQQTMLTKSKAKEIRQVLIEEIAHSVAYALRSTEDSRMNQTLSQVLTWILSSRMGRKALNYTVSLAYHSVRNKKYQLQQVKNLLQSQERDQVHQTVYLGHTHHILDDSLSYIDRDGRLRWVRVYNAGGHKKTIFPPNPEEFYPAGMLKVQYNRPIKQISKGLCIETERLSKN